MVLLGAVALAVVAWPGDSGGSVGSGLSGASRGPARAIAPPVARDTRPPADPSGAILGSAPTFQDVPVIPGFGPTGPTERATVVRVVDGDTVHVLLRGVDERLRYIGMDTPESVRPGTSVEPFALAASSANRALVDGAAVVLERDVSETDRFGRLLRYVWLERPDGWLLVNLELVRSGFAQAATFPPDVKYVALYLEAERVARRAGRGLWRDEH